MRSLFRGRSLLKASRFRTMCSSASTRKPTKIFEGTLIHSLGLNQLEIIENGRIGVDEQGEILFVAKNQKEKEESIKTYGYSPAVTVQNLGDKFLIPGFIDTHTHAPQYVFTGTGTGLPLLQWLEKYTFPYESKFSDPDFAEEVYSSAVSKHLSNGSTTTVYFGTIHTEATLQLARIAERVNQRAYIGKVNMDRNSPDHYRETTEESIAQTQKFVEEIIKRPSFKKGLIVPIITPRFVPTCTPKLMKFLGEIAAKYSLPIQSHISENKDEIEWVKDLHPDLKGYADVYDHFGLLNSNTIMAHACHLTPEETQSFIEKRVGVSHCPLSNISLNSGFMPLREMLDKGMKVGLGTDVSGGYSPSMLNAMRMAIATSAVHTLSSKAKPLTHIEAFYLATLGGSELLGEGAKLGNFKPGNNFDALVIDPKVKGSPFDVFRHDTVEGVFEKFIFLGDDRNITDVYVQGERSQTRS